MNKSLYSLMLMDDVVAEIDRIARSEGINRSNLINQILAEYASMMTPEKRIDSIFRRMEELLRPEGELIPYVTPHQQSMSVKSSLSYKYRPTIKYIVQLYRAPAGSIGELSVCFRTQSAALLDEITVFFRLFKRLEDSYIRDLYEEGALQYALYEGRFVRSLALPKKHDYTNEQLGQAISDYVRMFDALLKGYLNGSVNESTLETAYVNYLERGAGLV